MFDIADEFRSLPSEHQTVLQLAQEQHNIAITPLQKLLGGRTGAFLYLVSVSSAGSDQLKHLVLKLDRARPGKADELDKHQLALSQAPPDFAHQHMAELAFEKVETEDSLAIFYTIAGESLHRYGTLASHAAQIELEAIFSVATKGLLEEWNAVATFEQAVHPQELLARWLGRRLEPGCRIEQFLSDVCRIHPGIRGLIIEGEVFPNPLVFARQQELWGEARPIDALVGFQHGDLNVTNLLVKFASHGGELEDYYLIDFALFEAGMPLLFDQCYLEMSYLVQNVPRVAFAKWVDLVARFAGQDTPDSRQAPVELAGTSRVVGAGRSAFDDWLQASHPTLSDDLWGQFWLASVAAGLNFCNKAALPDQERLAGLIYAAAHLKRYMTQFGVPLPTEAADVYAPDRTDNLLLTYASPVRVPHKLPIPPTVYIGHEREVASARDHLLRDDVGLLTLTGPGGVGKTRLSLEVASSLPEHFEDGVFFVDLAPISAPGLVISTIAQTLEVRESGARSLLETVQDHLHDKRLLLLLDNFEQVLEAAPVVADLLSASPELKVLVTSRTPLNLRGEHEFRIPPLGLPEPREAHGPEGLSQYESVRLFIDRAQAAKANFAVTNENAPAVAEICHRLDGLPLAIELAAARIKLLPPEMILARLDDRLNLLTGGARDLPERQQTLRATLDWSYSLLIEDAQTLFARLGVFVGGFTLDAAEAICSPDSRLDVLEGVASLLNSSLLRQRALNGGQPRFRMLGTIHEYARERLAENGESEALRRQHAHFFVAKVEEMGPKLHTADSSLALEWFDSERENLRAALAWSQAAPEGLELGPRLVRHMNWAWFRLGRLSEGRGWAERVLSSTADLGPAARAAVTFAAGQMAMLGSDIDSAHHWADESLELSRQVGDEYDVAIALTAVGLALLNRGDVAAAHPMFEESLAICRQRGIQWVLCLNLGHLGDVAMGLGDYATARALLGEASVAAREIGEPWIIAGVENNHGDVARAQGDYDQARISYEESGALFREPGYSPDFARSMHSLGYVAQRQGEHQQAQAFFEASLSLFQEIGMMRGVAECLAGLAGLLADQGEPQRAAQFLSAAEAAMSALGAAWWPADQVEYDRNLSTIRAALDEDSFDKAWAEGQALELEVAVEQFMERGTDG
jgi:predicted ATPase/Tfp pilus assembly protein PilF